MRYVTVTIISSVKNENDADEISRLVARLAEALATTGHATGVCVKYVDRPATPVPRIVDADAN